MPEDEMIPQNDAVELSDEELNDVAGGFDLQFMAARSFQQTFTFAQGASLPGGGAAQSLIQSDTFEAALIQFTIKDATAEDLQALGGLLGNASAIEGDA